MTWVVPADAYVLRISFSKTFILLKSYSNFYYFALRHRLKNHLKNTLWRTESDCLKWETEASERTNWWRTKEKKTFENIRRQIRKCRWALPYSVTNSAYGDTILISCIQISTCTAEDSKLRRKNLCAELWWSHMLDYASKICGVAWWNFHW